MKILFLSQRVPYPPNKGDKLRSFNQIKYLARKHEIHLCCLTDNNEDLRQAGNLKPFCADIKVVMLPKRHSRLRTGLSLLSGRPLSLGYFHSPAFKEVVEQQLKSVKYDLIFVYCSSMAQYVMQVEHIPRVIDFVDVDSEKWLQYSRHAGFPWSLLYRIECRRLRTFERLVAQSFRHAFLVSEKETRDFADLVYPADSLTPIANGVDFSLFRPSDSAGSHDPYALVFTGAMDYFANVESVRHFVLRIMPLIQRVVPQVRLYVVGSSPAREIVALGEQNPQVTVTGYVDTVQPYVVRSAAMVAPMRIARGVQNKILEAMAMGVPVVTSALGLEGIAATPGVDILVADNPQAFADQVLRLMLDAGLRAEIAARGRSTVLRQYDWDVNMEKLERVLVEVAGEGAGVCDRMPAPYPSDCESEMPPLAGCL